MRLLSLLGALALLACSRRSAEPEEAATPQPAAAADAGAAAVDAAPAARERVVLAEVRAGLAEGQGGAVEAPALAEQLTGTLVMSGWFAHDARSVPTGHKPRPARLEVLVAGGMLRDRKSGHWLMMVTSQARLSWLDAGTDPAPTVNVAIERDLGPGKPGGQPVMQAALASVATMARALEAEERVRSGPPEEMRKALAGNDDDLRLWALELARERKPRDLVDDIGKLLASKDADVRERALGALIAIGDPRAAGAIADHARTDDLAFLRNAIDAVAGLGGEDAIEWLEFLAGGHPDAEIRAQAGRAVDKARQRARPAGP